MTTQRTFIHQTFLTGGTLFVSGLTGFTTALDEKHSVKDISDFAKRLKPPGRILELEGYFIWGTKSGNLLKDPRLPFMKK